MNQEENKDADDNKISKNNISEKKNVKLWAHAPTENVARFELFLVKQ